MVAARSIPSLLCAALILSSCASPFPSGAKPLPVRAWWAVSSTALRDIPHAGDYGVNTLIVENETGAAWNEVLDGLATYDFSDRFRKTGEARRRAEDLRRHYRRITEEARGRGIDCYLMCPEVGVPKGFAPLSYDNPALWTLLRERLREVFRALPDLRGFTLYMAEGGAEVVELPGGEPSHAARYRKLIETVWEACRAENRKLIVSTFLHWPAKLEAAAEALRGIPPHPDLMVLQYACPNDWGLYLVINPAIGRSGPHPEILGFDYCGENWGQGAHPFVHVDFMVERFREARTRSGRIAGLTGYVSWLGRNLFGTFNEANARAALALADDPGRDAAGILNEWCESAFGREAAPTAARCLARTREVVFKTQHVFGFWVDTGTKSGLPSLLEMDEFFIKDYWCEAIAKWDPKHRPTWRKIQNPDLPFVDEVVREKEEAAALCRRSLQEIGAARSLFRGEDFTKLERAFTFQEIWARMWREQTHAFFLRQIGKRDGWTPELRQRLETVLQTYEGDADGLEKGFGKGVFPRGPDRARDFIRDLRRDVAGN